VGIGRAWDKWRQLTEILCDRKISRGLKVFIYKTVRRPVLLYGVEKRPVTDSLAERVSLCEIRMLCYCLEITLEEHKTNQSIRQETKVMNVLEPIRRIQWFGYICRREKEDGIRRVRTMKVTGKRNPGCPKYRWQDTIIKDLQSCSLNEVTRTGQSKVNR